MSLPTVQIGIPAFNEQVNLPALLTALINQTRRNFRLSSITVYSDHSTDATNLLVKKLSRRFPIIHLVAARRRLGKYYRLNHIFAACKSDYLLVLDADIMPSDRAFLSRLIDFMNTHPRANLVSAHQILIRPHSGFIPRLLYTYLYYGDCVRARLPRLESPVNFYNSATIYRGNFARTLRIPTGLSDPHLYLYLRANKNRGYAYCRTAAIFQQPISALSDYLRLLRRPLGKPDPYLQQLFPGSNSVYSIPLRSKITGFFACLRREPFYTCLIPALLLHGKVYAQLHQPRQTSSLWEIARSTKKVI